MRFIIGGSRIVIGIKPKRILHQSFQFYSVNSNAKYYRGLLDSAKLMGTIHFITFVVLPCFYVVRQVSTNVHNSSQIALAIQNGDS